MDSDFDVVIAGHSFVRRLRDRYQPPHAHGSDVGIGQSIRASHLCDNLGLDHQVRGVYTFSNNINRIDDLWNVVPFVENIRSNVVVLHAGSNDLAQLHEFNVGHILTLATSLFNIAEHLNNVINIPMVIIQAVLPRTHGINCHPDVFAQMAKEMNKQLSNYCDKRTIIFNKLRGFSCFYENNKEMAKPVSAWSHDGIHCNTTSMEHYRKRVVHGILDNMCHLFL